MNLINLIVYILICICCLLFGHIRGYKSRKEEEDSIRVEIIFNEDFELQGVYCNGKLTTNVSARIEDNYDSDFEHNKKNETKNKEDNKNDI